MIVKLQKLHVDSLHALFTIVHSLIIQGRIEPVVGKIMEDIKTMLVVPTIDEAEKLLEELKQHIVANSGKDAKQDAAAK